MNTKMPPYFKSAKAKARWLAQNQREEEQKNWSQANEIRSVSGGMGDDQFDEAHMSEVAPTPRFAQSNSIHRQRRYAKSRSQERSYQTVNFNGVSIIPRDQWAQYEPHREGENSLIPDRTPNIPYNKITLHHAGRHKTPFTVEDYHRGKESLLTKVGRFIYNGNTGFGGADVAYDYMIDETGTIFAGRSLDYEGAHVRGHNTDNIGISFLGDYTDKTLTPQQLSAFGKLRHALNTEFSESGETLPVYSHGYFDDAKQNELKGARGQLLPLDVHFDQED